MKFGIFSRKKAIHMADGIPNSYYTAGEVFDGGAERFAFQSDIPHPLVGLPGGIPAGQLRLTEPARVYQYLALPVTALISGVQAGYVTTDPLLDPSTLPANSPLQSVFGGVQV